MNKKDIIIISKLEELKCLLIGKPLIEQKEIVVNFFCENRKISKHFKIFYKATKDIFKKSSLSDFYMHEFIEKTFINREEMFYYSTFNGFHNGTKIDMEEEEFGTYTLIKIKEQLDKLVWKDDVPDDLIEQQKDCLRKNKDFNVIPLQAWDVVIPLITKERKVCSKCGNEVFMPLYVERKRLFRKKYKKWCFSCYNKLKHGVGKLKLTDVVITGEKDNLVDCIHINILKSVNNHYSCKHIDNKSKLCNDKDCPIKMKLSIDKNYLATEKEITIDDVQFQICKDKDSKSLKEMKAECYKCGRNIGFNNIPSEICYECSIYDIEKPDNKFKSIKKEEN